ncbi:hypothetical protein SNOG_15006 [Parastagonospora nodorum SN15]|uniref:Uncharacterized protein n=1 Tax=Phaeosphaeria nodorum (strain SN15 / ATCC MYA-4574 / FGSC 10173) TaxID=321614 RepID=Q0TZJ5_PHANO|nr:hypothetical protein SNOG_15006 [Parastagonospora nodorum SN15]EAT77549.1 hypothetical protein SNOG_15006 [Parastagonospora nodorum SN15]
MEHARTVRRLVSGYQKAVVILTGIVVSTWANLSPLAGT